VSHPRHDLVELLQLPGRLSIVAALAAAPGGWLWVADLREHLELGDTRCSILLSSLVDENWIERHRTGRAMRVSLTDVGREGWETHRTALLAIVDPPQT
jgi:DNA-binding MarR family transcriptional regulator